MVAYFPRNIASKCFDRISYCLTMEVLSHIWARLGRRVVVERLRHSPPLPPVSSAPVGAARSRPGRQVGDPYQAQKLLAYSNHRDTHLFTIHSYLLPSPTQVGDVGRVRAPTYWYKPRSVSVCVTALLAPGFLHTGRGGSKPPGSPGWRSLPGSKAFGLQQPTGYHLFTIHSYLLPSPTQVGDAGRVRELTYSYKLRSGIKKSLADWRDFSVCVGITYLPGKSPCKYCRRR